MAVTYETPFSPPVEATAVLSGLLEPASALVVESTASHNEEAVHIADVLTWNCAILFLGFMALVLCWEILTAFAAWMTIYFSGRRAAWLQRVKVRIVLTTRPFKCRHALRTSSLLKGHQS